MGPDIKNTTLRDTEPKRRKIKCEEHKCLHITHTKKIQLLLLLFAENSAHPLMMCFDLTLVNKCVHVNRATVISGRIELIHT